MKDPILSRQRIRCKTRALYIPTFRYVEYHSSLPNTLSSSTAWQLAHVCQFGILSLPLRHRDPASCSQTFLPYEQNNTESIGCVLKRTYCRYYWITCEHSNSIRRVINTFVILPNQNCSTINGVSVENNKSISFLALVLHCDFVIAKRWNTSVCDRIRSRIIIEVKLLEPD